MTAKRRSRMLWLGIPLVVVVASLVGGFYYAWPALFPPENAEPGEYPLAALLLQVVGTLTPTAAFLLQLRTSGLRKEKLRLEVEKHRLEIAKMKADLERAGQG